MNLNVKPCPNCAQCFLCICAKINKIWFVMCSCSNSAAQHVFAVPSKQTYIFKKYVCNLCVSGAAHAQCTCMFGVTGCSLNIFTSFLLFGNLHAGFFECSLATFTLVFWLLFGNFHTGILIVLSWFSNSFSFISFLRLFQIVNRNDRSLSISGNWNDRLSFRILDVYTARRCHLYPFFVFVIVGFIGSHMLLR